MELARKEETKIQRLPPQDIEAEMAVLGAMFLESDAVGKALELLDENCFYKTAHQKIFKAAVELYDHQEPIDVITLADHLKKKGQLEEVGGNYYLIQLSEKVPSAANIEFYAKIVLEKALLRRLINVTTDITNRAYEHKGDVYSLLDDVEKEVFVLSERRLKKGFVSIYQTMHETFERIESFHGKMGGVTGIPSGFAELDEKTSGFQNSDLIVVAGRPSMGKTAFCLNIARNAAVEHGVPVGIFSLEMAAYQLAMRMLCSEARVDSHAVRTGKLPKDDWQKLSLSVGVLAEAPIYLDDSPALSILEIKAKARRLKYEKKIGLLIVDYLQLIQGPPGSESRQQEISSISQALKALAKELNIPVIALSQLSRAVESRGGDRRPMLSDLRESGAIEQDADVVIFIYRPEVYGRTEEEGIAEIIIGKQRSGPIGTVKLAFMKEYVLFANLTRIYADQEVAQPF
ncbi:MAG: replicative DNA helicase [candidate division KSB1 bacterium]|nr:replicative DNA helicase [candidate division KSB1 bacterium]MDZ7339801.1 replicative DNA helicase [candidate division KSB1 bacterium]